MKELMKLAFSNNETMITTIILAVILGVIISNVVESIFNHVFSKKTIIKKYYDSNEDEYVKDE